MRTLVTLLIIIGVSLFSANAQEVTYNHDKSKLNQITVMETGAGSLYPAVFYSVVHNKYRLTAPVTNKLSYRTLVGGEAYGQIDDAKRIDTSLTQRAKIETLNMIDRQVDLAWKAEGEKITKAMDKFQKNINKIVPWGGDINERSRWQEYHDMYNCAISATQDAHLPNAHRKREYLRIYADVQWQNDLLVLRLVEIHNAADTKKMLEEKKLRTADKEAIATAAMSRWKESSK